MARVWMVVAAGVIALIVGGMVYLGAFPPNPTPHQVEKVLPNTDLQAR